jgi:hypothetical protein
MRRVHRRKEGMIPRYVSIRALLFTVEDGNGGTFGLTVTNWRQW